VQRQRTRYALHGGVDLAVIGKSDVDGEEELLLLVIKQGDLGRRDWDNGEPTSVRPSLNEVLDVYLTKLVAMEHREVRKKIILATTGELKQDVETNWNSYKEANKAKATFEFWGADKVSNLVERYLLNENIFEAQDRSDLRRSLALAADSEYDFRDLNNLLLRQFGLTNDGKLIDSEISIKDLLKAFRRSHLAAQICAHWALEEGDSRKALWVNERVLLWAWHRTQLVSLDDRPKMYLAIGEMLRSHITAASRYFEVMNAHFYVRDGMAGYSSEGAAFSIVLFEHIGIVSSIGLTCLLQRFGSELERDNIASNVKAIADGLCALIGNHGASASPRLDEHIVDISLGLFFLTCAGRMEQAKKWTAEISTRLDFCYGVKRNFPVSTDSVEDLVELEVNPGDERLVNSLMSTSWTLATISAWSVIFGLDEHYASLSKGNADEYKNVCAQLWHPSKDWPELWYFGGALEKGETEAPYVLLPEIESMRQRIVDFMALDNYDWAKSSPSHLAGVWAIDFIACRHFRIPLPASVWYRFLPMNRSSEQLQEKVGSE